MNLSRYTTVIILEYIFSSDPYVDDAGSTEDKIISKQIEYFEKICLK